jgi:porphobilinogen deaminase
MDGIVGSVDGTKILRATAEGDADDPVGLGHILVEVLLEMGAAAILADVRSANVMPEPAIDSQLET